MALLERCLNTYFFSGPYFPVIGLNVGKYGPGKTPYLETFHTVWEVSIFLAGWKNYLKVTSFFIRVSSGLDCPKKSLFWRISQNLPENTPQGVSLQETPGQVFPSEFCEIFKNTFFKKHHWTTPSMNQYQMLFPENSPTEI